eukprot:jgi/Psemu1/64310/estExt_Genemark1.C_590048
MFGGSQTPFGSPAGGFGQPANSTPAFGTPAPAFGQAPAAGGFGGSKFRYCLFRYCLLVDGSFQWCACSDHLLTLLCCVHFLRFIGTFGSTAPSAGGFGSTGGFGAAPAPGGFGAAPAPAFGAPAPSTGFGAPSAGGFGAPATSSPFGAPAPATGGLFGSSPAPATGGLFGSSPAPATGAFGAPAPATGGFGGGGAFGASSTPAFGAPAPAAGGLFGSTPAPATGGLFGSAPAPAAGGFGSSTGGFGSAPAPAFGAPAPATGMFGAPAPAPTGGLFGSTAPAAGSGGTKIAPFQPAQRVDGTTQITLHSISAMQQYMAKSPEELRFEDYGQGNKGSGAAQTGGFGSPATGAFGAPAPATGAFGAPAPATGGLFGSAPAPSTTFGGFGAPAPATGAFGAPAAPTFGAAPAPATGAFGAPAPAFGAAPAPSGGLFGSTAPAPATGSLFGAPSPAPAGGLFGSAPAPAPSTGFGGFGTSAPAPAPAFGAAPAPSGGLFGSSAPAPATGSLFGTPAPAPAFGAAPAPAFGMYHIHVCRCNRDRRTCVNSVYFHNNDLHFSSLTEFPLLQHVRFASGASTGAFGAPAPPRSLFGSTPAPAPAGGSLFGAAPAAPSLFGAPAPAPATGSFFGAPAAAPVAPAPPAVAYAPPALGAVMPPAANEIMASQLAALESKRKEMEQSDNFRNRPAESSSVTALTLSESQSKRNTIVPATPVRISSYRASPMSNAKLRPRGFASPPSDTNITAQTLSKLGAGGKPMAAPETIAASAATRLIIAPSPKPKLKLTLGVREKKVISNVPSPTPIKVNGIVLNGGLGSVQKAARTPEPMVTPKNLDSTPLNGLSATPTNGELDQAQQYYQQVVNSSTNSEGTPSEKKKQMVAPTLSKNGYSCNPSISSLQEMEPADLAAVTNFSVARTGVGKVEWEGAVDVRGANLDRIVVIESKSVSIYTDEEEEGRKPEVGTKLNRPAILTLEGVFPPDPSDADKFVKKVTRQTVKMGAELISYDPSTGEWILRVKHFSRYGLDDDSDDDEEMENVLPEHFEQKEETQGRKVDFRFGEREGRSPVSSKEGIKKMARQDTPYKMKGGFILDGDEEDDEMMKTSDSMTEASMMDEAEKAFTRLQSSLDAETTAIALRKKIEKDTAAFHEEGNTINENDASLGKPRYIPSSEDLREAEAMPSFSLKLAKSKLVSNKKASSIDFGLRMGRSFRIGWSPDGSFFSLAKKKNGILIRKRPKVEDLNLPDEMKLLEAHRSHVQKIQREGDCPLFALTARGVRTNPIKKTLETYSQAVKDTEGVLDSTYSLLQVLHTTKTIHDTLNSQVLAFGGGSRPENHVIENECMISITRWFIDSCSAEVGSEIIQARANQQKNRALLSAVSGGDLSTAAKIAEEENLLQLSILLASSPECRKDVFQEVMAWRKNGVTPKLPENLSRAYRLIAGDLGMEENVYKNSRKGSDNFDWKRRMVMKLMFSKPEVACKTLASVIEQYEADVSKGVAPFPSALYCSGKVESTLFRLLRLGTDAAMSSTDLSLSNVVDPSGYTDDRNNFSLSFHLTSCITSIFEAASLTPEQECTLLDGYAFQLQSRGLWEWAVYVFLCVLSGIDSVPSTWRIQRAKDLILQNYCDGRDNNAMKRQFLENLGLPYHWFEEALSYRSRISGDDFGYIEHKLNVDITEGTKILERVLIPNILFTTNEDRDRVLPLLEGIAPSVESKSLVVAIVKFFGVLHEIELLERSSREEIEDIVPTLLKACDEIQQVFYSYKASEEKLVDNGLDIVPEKESVPMGSFLSEALHQTSHFKLQILASKEGMGMASTASQMLKLVKSQGTSDYSFGNRENICRWLM